MLAALNYLDILTADIQNAYLKAPAAEKVWFQNLENLMEQQERSWSFDASLMQIT